MTNPPKPSTPIVPIRKSGSEPIRGAAGEQVDILLSFWTWAFSQTLDNALRGVFAEYLVGLALGVVGEGVRVEWDAYDLITSAGTRVEVKSTAYLQSWEQKVFSTPTFSVREANGWSADSNTWATEKARCADVYVFCLFAARDRATADPLDTRQWQFYVTSTKRLNAILGSQQTINLNQLIKRVEPMQVAFEELAAAVESAIRG